MAVYRHAFRHPLLRRDLGEQIGSQGLALLARQLDVGCSRIDGSAGVGPGAGRNLVRLPLQTGAGGGRICRAWLNAIERGVLPELHNSHIERQFGIADWLVLIAVDSQQRLRHHHYVVVISLGRVDDRQLDRAMILHPVDRFAFFDRHLPFDRQQADEQLTAHHQPHAQVQQHDAGPLLEEQRAAREQHQARTGPLDQLPQNAHRGGIEFELRIDEQPGVQRSQDRGHAADQGSLQLLIGLERDEHPAEADPRDHQGELQA